MPWPTADSSNLPATFEAHSINFSQGPIKMKFYSPNSYVKKV